MKTGICSKCRRPFPTDALFHIDAGTRLSLCLACGAEINGELVRGFRAVQAATPAAPIHAAVDRQQARAFGAQPPLPAGTDLAQPCRCGHPRGQHLHARQHCIAAAAQPMKGTCLCVEFQPQP